MVSFDNHIHECCDNIINNKICSTCLYKYNQYNNKPCNTCKGFNNWIEIYILSIR